MVRKTPLSILFDNSHGNLFTFEDVDLLEFKSLLESLGYNILDNLENTMSLQDLINVKILIIGVPTSELSKVEIQRVKDFVRNGGALLLVQSHGGDHLQNTNLNELASSFGMKFENVVLKSNVNAGVPTLPIINVTSKNSLMKGIRKLVFGGACCLSTMKSVTALVETSSECFFEGYNSESQEWEQLERPDFTMPISAINNYGLGKVAAICSLDMFSSNNQFGLDSLDNKKFLINIFNWLAAPNSDEEVKFWMLDQIGAINLQVESLTNQIQNLLRATFDMNSRLTVLEEKKLEPES